MRKIYLFILLITFNLGLVTAQNVTYQTLHTSTTFNGRTINESLPVGGISAAADVSSGGASYSISIAVPPGTNGISPSVSVNYYSMGGNGVLGQGWGIGGLSEITRTTRNMYFDNETNPIVMTNNDRFVLDGTRLISKSGNYGDPNATYGTESENFATITSKSAQGNGPEWFEVVTKDGIKMEYGNSPDSRQIGQFATVLRWGLSKIQYPDGNYISLKYKTDVSFTLLIDEINYTGNVAQSLAPYNQIKFDYKIRTIDENTGFEDDTRMESKYLLDKITTKADGLTVRSYQFNYGHDNISSFLKEVIEAGSAGTALNATIFKYGDTPAEFSTVTTDGYDDPAATTITGDFNADGLTDFLEARLMSSPSAYRMTIFTKEPAYSGAPNNFYVGNVTDLPVTYQAVKKNEIPNSFDFLAYDFTGDGADDVLMTNIAGSGTNRTLTSLHLYKTLQTPAATFPIAFDPVVISPYTGYSKIHPSGHFIFPGDYDGDGIQDILTMLGSNSVNYNCHLYNGRVQPDFGSIVITGTFNFPVSDWATVDKVHIIDFNGDGKSDVMLIKDTNCEIFTFDGWVARRIHFSSSYLNNNHLSYFGDFNGDRKTDVLAKLTTTGAWKILISNGRNFYESPFSFNTTPDTDLYTGDHLAVADVNGDGKADIYHGWQLTGSATSNFDVYYGKGYAFSPSLASFYRINSTYTTNLGAPAPMIGDFNGDGRTDLINFKNIFTPMDVFYLRKEGRENLLEKVKNGYNHVTEWNYKKLTDENGFHVRGILTAYPFNAFQPPLYTVSDFKLQNGIGGFSTSQYTYEGTKLHRAGKGFLGFSKITAIDQATGMKTVSENEFNTTYYTAVPYRTSTYLTSSGALLNQATHTNAFVSPAAKRFWIKTTDISENNVFEGRTSTTVNVYDNFGNVTQSTVNNGVESIFTTTGYGAYPAGILNKPTTVSVSNTRTGQPTHNVTTAYGYNSIGQLTSKTDFNGSSKNVATVYEYFPLGNLKKTTVTPNGAGASATRSTSSIYDLKGRYAESSTNELSQTSGATYDPKWGKQLTATGVDGKITTYQYDAFGNATTTSPPAPVAYNVTQSYGWDQTNGAVWYSLLSHPGKPNIKTWYDVLGREIKTETEGFGGQPIIQTKTYDARGNVASSTQPYKSGETIITTTTQFDDYNRPNNVNSGSLGTTTIGYTYASGNLTTTTTAPAGTSSQTTDASGKLINATDNGGTLTYIYFSHGGLKEVKNGSVTLASNQYDTYGRQTQLVDANSGTTQYDYNALGELVSQTSANGQTYTMAYDVSGRITGRARSGEPSTLYQYYTSGNGINQIEKVTGFSGNLEEFTYDAYGRMLTVKETVDGTAHTTTHGYNNYGDITSTSYPSGFGTNHAYDANGYPTTIKNNDNSVTLYTNTAMNGLGQNTSYSLGNGQASTVNYTNGYPTQYLAGTKQNLNLVWDYQKGTLTSRNDAIKSKTESFTYDNLTRLKNTTIGATTLTTNYASNGNIADKPDAGAYSYHATKFNAATGVTNPAPSPIPLLQQDITYTAFMQPNVVTENGYELAYTYGADYERIKSVTKQNSSIVNTRYYFTGYDKDITGGSTKYIHHIGSPAGLIAIVVSDGSIHTPHYTYTDHLGSILTVTNSSGTVETEQSFDAWGRRRNPTTWALLLPTAVTSLPYWLYRGYTGHEHLDNFGLINMNGRMYDPVVGRMLSPDNFVQSDGFTQSYNRYSYAGNNPLRYTDPDGEFFKLGFFAIAFTAELASNLLNHKGSALKNAFHNANFATNAMSNALQIPLFSNGKNSGTIGIDILSFGISANFYHTEGNLTSGVGVGVGLMSGATFNWSASYAAGALNIGIAGGVGASYSAKTGGWAHSYSAFGGSIKYKEIGLSYYQTHYGNAIGPDGKPNNQVVGGVNLTLGEFSFRIENDFLAFADEDRWRSNAVEIGIGNFVVGTRLYNNDPKTEGLGFDPNGKDRMGNKNTGEYGAWNNGKVYSSPLWVGARFGNTVDRIGYSHPMVQDRTQNWVHRNGFFYLPFGHQNFYTEDSDFKKGAFLHTGYYNPYSLWGK
jgi:RHS repeat-associated protein